MKAFVPDDDINCVDLSPYMRETAFGALQLSPWFSMLEDGFPRLKIFDSVVLAGHSSC